MVIGHIIETVQMYKVKWSRQKNTAVQISYIAAESKKEAEQIVRGLYGEGIVIKEIVSDYNYELELIRNNID